MQDETLTRVEARASQLQRSPDAMLSVFTRPSVVGEDGAVVLLTAAGTLSGTTISYREYAGLMGLTDNQIDLFDDESSETVSDDAYEELSESGKAETIMKQTRGFIHLKNVMVVGANIATINLPVLRVRQSEVIGWYLGSLSEKDPEVPRER